MSEAHSALWGAVVMAALHDLDNEPYDGDRIFHDAYDQSVLLFTKMTGPWADWRAELAGFLDMDEYDLRRAGCARIAARERREPRPAKAALTELAPVVVAAAPAPTPTSMQGVPVAFRAPSNEWLRRFIGGDAAAAHGVAPAGAPTYPSPPGYAWSAISARSHSR